MKLIIDYENKYNEGIILDEYNGEYSLVVGQKGDDGNVYKRWAFPQIKREAAKKAIPWAIRLGDAKAAISRLEKIIDELRAETGDPGREPEGGDIPF